MDNGLKYYLLVPYIHTSMYWKVELYRLRLVAGTTGTTGTTFTHFPFFFPSEGSCFFPLPTGPPPSTHSLLALSPAPPPTTPLPSPPLPTPSFIHLPISSILSSVGLFVPPSPLFFQSSFYSIFLIFYFFFPKYPRSLYLNILTSHYGQPVHSFTGPFHSFGF